MLRYQRYKLYKKLYREYRKARFLTPEELNLTDFKRGFCYYFSNNLIRVRMENLPELYKKSKCMDIKGHLWPIGDVLTRIEVLSNAIHEIDIKMNFFEKALTKYS